GCLPAHYRRAAGEGWRERVRRCLSARRAPGDVNDSPRRRQGVRRAVVVLPNGFTLANLFFGVFAIVSASRGDFTEAGWYVVLGGVADAFDGRIARVTRTGSRFGEELD